MKRILTAAAIMLALISSPFTTQASDIEAVCGNIKVMAESMAEMHYSGNDSQIMLIINSFDTPEATNARIISKSLYKEIRKLPTNIPASEKRQMQGVIGIAAYVTCLKTLQ